MSDEANEVMRMELESADLTVLRSLAAMASERPEVITVVAGAGEQSWQEIKSDPAYDVLHAALIGSGAGETAIAAALQTAAEYGSGQPADPAYQSWANLRNSLIEDARALMQALEAYEALNGVEIDRAYLEDKTQMVSIATWALEGN